MSLPTVITDRDAQLIGRCLAETAKRLWRRGAIHTRLGVDDDDMRAVTDAWPEETPAVDDTEIDRSVRGALLEVASCFRFSDDQWCESIGGTPRAQVRALFERVDEWQKQSTVNHARADLPDSEMRSIFDLLEACDLLPAAEDVLARAT